MNITFQNKNVVITGGNAGIGLATATAFAKSGANVAICARREDKLNSAVASLKQFGTTVYGGLCDVSDSKQLLAFADDAEKALGTLDVWVSNAAIGPSAKIIDTPEEMWDQYFNINVKSIYVGAKIAKAKMKNGGVLINASSFASIMPSVNTGVYAATKAAVSSLTKTLASELAPYNIRVVAYIPGVIHTDINHAAIEKNREQMLSVIPLQKFGTPEDIANGILFLASDFASYITGTCLEVTGGKFATQNPSAAWND